MLTHRRSDEETQKIGPGQVEQQQLKVGGVNLVDRKDKYSP